MAEKGGMLDDPKVVEYRAKYAKYGGGPPPTDRFAKDRWTMAGVHILVFNHIEAVYKNASHVSPNDLPTYLDVARHAFTFIEHHHDTEEEVYFPEFDKKGISMSLNRTQHRMFHAQLEAIVAYVDSVNPKKSSEGKEKYSPARLRALIDDLLLPLAQHMAEELDTLDPEVLRQRMTIKELDVLYKALMKHTQQVGDPIKDVTLMWYSQAPGSHFFDDFPWLATHVAVPLMAWMNAGRQKYLYHYKRWEHTPVTIAD